jgi:PAS domain S-box-containing protein
MVTMHDFTESKRAEMSLQREKENLSTTLENNPNGIVLFDNVGKWIYGNPMLTEMTGYTAEDIQTGREWFQKAYPDAGLRKKVIDAWKKDRSQLEKGEVHEFDVTCKDRPR